MPPVADARAVVDVDGPLTARHVVLSSGTAADPTHWARGDEVRFAANTPDGPVAVRLRVERNDGHGSRATVDGWGDGAAWVTARAPALCGIADDPRPLRFDDERLDELNRRHPGLRHGATGCVVDSLLGRILGQRVLAREASRSWASLCRTLGGDAPGPLGLMLPPHHERVANSPTWWFHDHGVDRKRATAFVEVARRANRLAEVVDLPLPQAYGRMRAIRGLGPWTVNGTARAALGDPDAITVGDYWISHTVCSFFTGRARGSDEEMLALTERWTGQRGRVERLVHLSGHRIQRFAPGIAAPDIRRM